MSIDLNLGLLIDETLQLIEVIGEGSSGVVYLAEDLTKSSKNFAVKRLDKSAMGSQDLEDFKREVFVLKRLTGHPNIVAFHKLIETPDFYYLVMEHCETDLFDAIFLRCGFPSALVKRFFGNIADGLSFCHQNGIFHRDIKVRIKQKHAIN
jgi:serine/threonine protein kinase